MNISGRILGIDYGTKRIGVAISDPDARFALPHSVIANTSEAVDEIVVVASTNGVGTIVIGESRDYKGQPNKIMSGVLALKQALEAKGYAVHLELEFMTSHQADRLHHELGGDGTGKDASAAAIILQSYLDKRQNV